MANQVFQTAEDLFQYREERLAFIMADVYAACHTLSTYLKPASAAIFRKGKSVPIIKKGEIIQTKRKDIKDSIFIYEEESTKYPTFTYKDFMASSEAIYSEDKKFEIIPSIPSGLRSNLFKDTPVVPHMFVKAFTGAVSIIMSHHLNKDLIIDYADVLEQATVFDMTYDELRTTAVNVIMSKSVKKGLRPDLSEKNVQETIELLTAKKKEILELIVEEVVAATNNSIVHFVSTHPCSRYHFDEYKNIFYIERGVDFRIYDWEMNKFNKIDKLEESTGLSFRDMDLSRFSASSDFLK